MSTEGTLNVCHTLDVYRRAILGCDKVTGYMWGVVCHVAEIHLFSSRYTPR